MPTTTTLVIDNKLRILASQMRIARASYNFDALLVIWSSIDDLLDQRLKK